MDNEDKTISICNYCKAEFSNAEAIVADTQGKYEYLMIICPQCKTVFPISISDKRMQERQSRIKSLHELIQKQLKSSKVNVREYEMLYDKYKNLVQQNLDDNKRTMEKYGVNFTKYGVVHKSE